MFSFILTLSLTAVVHPGLQALQKTFKHQKSLEASFNQKIVQDLFPDSPDEASGTLKFLRPNKMIWTYETPRKRVIEYDGMKLTVNENGKTDTQSVSGAVTLEQSFSFLWGEPDPKVFKVQTLSPRSFRVIPLRTDEVTFKHIDVIVEAGKVSEAKVYDKLGSTSLMKFNWK